MQIGSLDTWWSAGLVVVFMRGVKAKASLGLQFSRFRCGVRWHALGKVGGIEVDARPRAPHGAAMRRVSLPVVTEATTTGPLRRQPG